MPQEFDMISYENKHSESDCWGHAGLHLVLTNIKFVNLSHIFLSLFVVLILIFFVNVIKNGYTPWKFERVLHLVVKITT